MDEDQNHSAGTDAGEDIFWAIVGLIGLYWLLPPFLLIFKFFASLIGLDFD